MKGEKVESEEGEIVFWCCGNGSCKRKNWNYLKDVEEKVIRGGEPLICRTCGVVHNFVKKESPKGIKFLECIPFEGFEGRLPNGGPEGDGRFKDVNNRLLTETEFIKLNGVHPGINWTWRQLGSPKPSRRCIP